MRRDVVAAKRKAKISIQAIPQNIEQGIVKFSSVLWARATNFRSNKVINQI
jgi:hypothetical protein